MGGIAFDGGHQLGYEVVALFQLHVDVGKSVLAVVAQFDQVVVDAGHDEAQHDYNGNDNQ